MVPLLIVRRLKRHSVNKLQRDRFDARKKRDLAGPYSLVKELTTTMPFNNKQRATFSLSALSRIKGAEKIYQYLKTFFQIISKALMMTL